MLLSFFYLFTLVYLNAFLFIIARSSFSLLKCPPYFFCVAFFFIISARSTAVINTQENKYLYKCLNFFWLSVCLFCFLLFKYITLSSSPSFFAYFFTYLPLLFIFVINFAHVSFFLPFFFMFHFSVLIPFCYLSFLKGLYVIYFSLM